MKYLLTLSILLASIQAFSAEENLCKREAHIAAYDTYAYENPNTGFTLRGKFKPLLDEKKISHIVEILEFDNNRVTHLTITLDNKSCKVLSID